MLILGLTELNCQQDEPEFSIKIDRSPRTKLDNQTWGSTEDIINTCQFPAEAGKF